MRKDRPFQDVTPAYFQDHPARPGVSDDYLKILGKSNEPPHVRRGIEVGAGFAEAYNPGLTKEEIARRHLRGVDFNARESPRVVELPKGTRLVAEERPGGQGAYYRLASDGSHDRHGISHRGRERREYEAAENVLALKSRCADLNDDFSPTPRHDVTVHSRTSDGAPSHRPAEFAFGGGEQFYVPEKNKLRAVDPPTESRVISSPKMRRG